jgi:hypothetical protein
VYNSDRAEFKKIVKDLVIKAGFNTGGYTGEWGPEGRLAMLH